MPCAVSWRRWKKRSRYRRSATGNRKANRRSRAAAERGAGATGDELSRYRSEFFGRLRAILGNRPDIRIVGDRFVFQSEVFFKDTGQALLLPEGRAELDKLASALAELDKQIPAEIAWGAAGRRPH